MTILLSKRILFLSVPLLSRMNTFDRFVPVRFLQCMNTVSIGLWAFYFLFAAAVTFVPALAPPAAPSPASGWIAIRVLIGVVLASFLGYTIYCSFRESLFKTMRKMGGLHWGRQIGIDLYIGLLLFGLVVGILHGSAAVLLLWLLPALIYGNLVPLLYFLLHFNWIIATLVQSH